MKHVMNATRSVLMTFVAGTALVTASTAFAQVYGAPQPRYDEPAQAPAPGAAITFGWHGDRYWDGHRYWEHDEWMHDHPHERDPRRDHDHEREHANTDNSR
ncbi:hypothetical protein [Paraburkholderia aspalathi]|uniref:PXPV repeat-containing protein n=1 Tax=Paraburkholderia aspalathi TaxID=1324617 RepID=A0A1I7ES79_9BURK|nr:hypothetical protein [Paraburkholderia aspalathi]SFU26789.1 hypothetical protein SAMN05192563_10736 [Paraburkholderia aspalathi]